MRVEVRCFASLRELAQDRCELTLAPATTVEDAWTAMAARHPGLRPHRPYVRAARNGAYAGWEPRRPQRQQRRKRRQRRRAP